MSQRDPADMVEDDLEKFRRYRQRDNGFDGGKAAWAEAILFLVSTVVAIAWLASLLWVPETIDGATWMSLGALFGLLFGVPTVGLYWVRRGGVATLARFAREFGG